MAAFTKLTGWAHLICDRGDIPSAIATLDGFAKNEGGVDSPLYLQLAPLSIELSLVHDVSPIEIFDTLVGLPCDAAWCLTWSKVVVILQQTSKSHFGAEGKIRAVLSRLEATLVPGLLQDRNLLQCSVDLLICCCKFLEASEFHLRVAQALSEEVSTFARTGLFYRLMYIATLLAS